MLQEARLGFYHIDICFMYRTLRGRGQGKPGVAASPDDEDDLPFYFLSLWGLRAEDHLSARHSPRSV